MRFILLISILILTACQVQQPLVRHYDLNNSQWKIRYDLKDEEKREFLFKLKPGGELQWKHPGSQEMAVNSFWTVNLDTLVLTTNSGYARFEGLFVTQDSLKGNAKNQMKSSWEWTAIRVKK